MFKFKDYLKEYLKDKDVKNIHIALNSNVSSIVELSTGRDYDKTTLFYDFKKAKPITEIKSCEWNNRITLSQKDFENNSVSTQKFEIKEFGPYGIYKYNVLQEQTFEQYDKDGNLQYTETMKESPVKNVFDVQKTLPSGQVKDLCKAYYTKEGNTVIEKDMESLDGTKTIYRYEDDTSGNRILDYKITDKSGKTLMKQSITFEAVDENHFISTRNNKAFDIKVENDCIIVKNLQNNKIAKIELKNFTHSTQYKLLPLLKQIPGDELFMMKELNLKALKYDEKTRSACFSPTTNEISLNEKYIDLGVALHEWGHAKDELVFKEIGEEIGEEIWKDENLQKIYQKEKKAFREHFSEAQLEHIGYFASDYHYLGGAKAIKEGIAETNTLLSINPKNDTQAVRSHYWQQYFPRTIAYLSGILN